VRCGYEGESEIVWKEVAETDFQIVASDDFEENLKTGVRTVYCCHDLDVGCVDQPATDVRS
jgi:hypothetical protein